jgi:hypothetical protein
VKKKIDFNFYEGARKDFLAVLNLRKPQKWEELNNEISVYCACVGLPVIVAIQFVKENYPQYLTQLEQKEIIVREFYDYEI